MPATSYVHAGAASRYASTARSISLHPATVESINAFLDFLLRETVDCLVNEAGASNQPLSIVQYKEAFTHAITSHSVGKTPTCPASILARDAILDAEVEAREWIQRRGKASDPALFGHPATLSRRGSTLSALALPSPLPSPLLDMTETFRPERRNIQDVYRQLQNALERLSPLGTRSAFPTTSTASTAAAATQLFASPNNISLEALSPLLCVYASAINIFLAKFVVSLCAKVVEQDWGKNVAGLAELNDAMYDDIALNMLWKAFQKTQSVIIPSSTHALQSVTSSAYDRSHPESAVAIGAGLASSAPAIGRPAILEKKGSLVRRKKLKSLHSNIPSSSNTPVSATPDQFGRISGIPVTTSRNRTNSAGSNSNAQVSTEMMAFVDLTGQGPFNELKPRSASIGHPVSHTYSKSAGQVRPATSAATTGHHQISQYPLQGYAASASNSLAQSRSSTSTILADDFDELIMGDKTVKMSLTPSRFKFPGMMLSRSTDGERGGTGRTQGRQTHSSAPPTSASVPSVVPRVNRLTPRTARQARGDAIVEEADNERTEDLASNQLAEDADLIALGIVPRSARNGKKESFMDVLNSEPPWAAKTPEEAAPKVLGTHVGAYKRFASDSMVTSGRPSQRPSRQITPIANMESMLASTNSANVQSGSLRPGTGTSLRPSTAGSSATYTGTGLGGATGQTLSDFPLPPGPKAAQHPVADAFFNSASTANSAHRYGLTSHKSSPNLSTTASSHEVFAHGDGPVRRPPGRKLVAKDERAIGEKGANDDLIAFFRNAPPPPSVSFGALALAPEPTSPTSQSMSGKTGSRLRGLLKKGSLSLGHNFASSSSATLTKDQGDLGKTAIPAGDNTGRKISQQYKPIEDDWSPPLNFGMPLSGGDYAFPAKVGSLDCRASSGPQGYPGSTEINIRKYAAPLLTPEHSKHDLYTPKSPYHVPTGRLSSNFDGQALGLDTPPFTPPRDSAITPAATSRQPHLAQVSIQEARRPSAASAISSRSDRSYSLSPATYPLDRVDRDQIVDSSPRNSASHPSAPAQGRRTSLVKRKPTPRVDVEELRGVGAPVEAESVVRYLPASTEMASAPDSSPSYTTSDFDSQSDIPRQREASHNSHYSSASTNSVLPKAALSQPAPWSVQRVLQQHASEMQKREDSQSAKSISEAGESITRPASTIVLPVAPLSADTMDGTSSTNEILNHVLMNLRNCMLSATSVNECLDLVDAALFEVAYDIHSPSESQFEHFNSIDSAMPAASETRLGASELAPTHKRIWHSSQVTNRALTSILEWQLENSIFRCGAV